VQGKEHKNMCNERKFICASNRMLGTWRLQSTIQQWREQYAGKSMQGTGCKEKRVEKMEQRSREQCAGKKGGGTWNNGPENSVQRAKLQRKGCIEQGLREQRHRCSDQHRRE
jgi:hypothetical protein